jgi:hypothetical protein
MAVAVHGSTGLDFAGFELVEKTKFLVLSIEEEEDDLQLRMEAACQAFSINSEEVSRSVALVPRNDKTWRISIGRNPIIQEHEIDQLSRFCRSAGVGAIIIDPLRKTHQSDENDTTSMDAITEAFTRLATKANAAVMICHHVGKRTDKGSIAGDAGAARGASSMIDAARLAYTLVNATEKDVILGIPKSEVKNHVRLDMAKANLVKMTDAPVWFVKDERVLPNGETAFALKPVAIKPSRTKTSEVLARVLVDIFESNNTRRLTWFEASRQVVARDPLFGMHADTETTQTKKISIVQDDINKLITFEGCTIKVGDKSITLKRTAAAGDDGKSQHYVEMETTDDR